VPLTPDQENRWRIALELKMRKSQGDAFQDFFCTMMEQVHGSDFVRVRAFGQLGDKGCDGYMRSNGHVFQCYGALGGGSEGKVSYLIKKIGEDFAKAVEKIAEIMKAWSMVHNFVDGLPVAAVEELEKLEKADGKRKLSFASMPWFELQIFSLDPAKIERLLGPAATAEDFQNMQAAELRDLIAAIITVADSDSPAVGIISPVPVDKLEFNKLSGVWRWFISGGCQNSPYVAEYLNRHPDPLMGERIAQLFRDRYRYLRAENLPPDKIMVTLYEMIVGVGAVSTQRQVAAQALLAFLFESCDIFEDQPSKVN
jgi:hypothetical protein